MVEPVITHYLGSSVLLISSLLKILISFVAKNRPKSPHILCNTDVTLITTMKKKKHEKIIKPTQLQVIFV